MSDRKHRRGFTLVELSAMMAFVVAGTSLGIPAVQRAREAARKTECRDHLHNLGVAMHDYCEAWDEYLPPAWTAHSWKADSTPHFGWGASLLPWIEQKNIYDRLNWDKPKFDDLTKAVIRVYRCPSDVMPGLNPVRGGWAAMSYSGNFGPVAPPRLVDSSVIAGWVGQADTPRKTDGIMWCNGSPALTQIVNADGTSNTMLLAERSAKSGGAIWAGVRGNEFESDNTTACPIGDAPNKTINSFSSFHPGGVNVLMCDGAVKFASNKIDTGTKPGRFGVWQNVSSYRDGSENTSF